MQSVPSGLQGYIREDTHLVSQETGAIMPLLTISSTEFLICFQYSMGTFHWACWTEVMAGQS